MNQLVLVRRYADFMYSIEVGLDEAREATERLHVARQSDAAATPEFKPI
jgi:hypothetical protein